MDRARSVGKDDTKSRNKEKTSWNKKQAKKTTHGSKFDYFECTSFGIIV